MAPTTPVFDDLTIAELATAVATVLATGYDGVRSGRVRHLPDPRTIRWYQTLGMVDRPAAFRGRTALFTRRHVLQLAAIKKLQASGHPLADIQRGLVGKTDAELARAAGATLSDVERCIAGVIDGRKQGMAAASPVMVQQDAAAPRPAGAFWKLRPAAAAEPPAGSQAPPALQSIGLDANAALLWSGRPLTQAETDAVTRLAKPLVQFLASRATGAAAEPAAGTAHSSSRPQRKGARP
jgi:DNA-binding transcriptional MerR regulator